LYFEGDAGGRYRIIRAVKNRFGAVNEISVFAMSETGLKQVENPSAIFDQLRLEAQSVVVWLPHALPSPLNLAMV
jgi:predicted ATP-dependent serine protease